ncbi:hypothetical protein ACN38_g198 [Penicillium nordicum]|uniref:Uncharacterized protein n=1 Tax=Penicillium nordicum TaxID=229535 RepID=A0A0M8PJA6_9EURO|nr:hypothetical protein ACN38_g198 [Penicillium nordicum]
MVGIICALVIQVPCPGAQVILLAVASPKNEAFDLHTNEVSPFFGLATAMRYAFNSDLPQIQFRFNSVPIHFRSPYRDTWICMVAKGVYNINT